MSEEQTLKMTDLDYLIGSHRLQMIKAALPYVEVPQQKLMSMMVKFSELERTIKLFQDNEDGMVGICSMENRPSSPLDMLNAIKPYGTTYEQDFIDLIINFMQGSRLYRSYQDTQMSAESSDNGNTQENSWHFPFEQFINLLPPEQQSKFETMQMVMQTMQQFT